MPHVQYGMVRRMNRGRESPVRCLRGPPRQEVKGQRERELPGVGFTLGPALARSGVGSSDVTGRSGVTSMRRSHAPPLLNTVQLLFRSVLLFVAFLLYDLTGFFV